MKVLWFLPTHGDGRYLGTATGGRVVDHERPGVFANRCGIDWHPALRLVGQARRHDCART